jgi:hypothetical protein
MIRGERGNPTEKVPSFEVKLEKSLVNIPFLYYH